MTESSPRRLADPLVWDEIIARLTRRLTDELVRNTAGELEKSISSGTEVAAARFGNILEAATRSVGRAVETQFAPLHAEIVSAATILAELKHQQAQLRVEHQDLAAEIDAAVSAGIRKIIAELNARAAVIAHVSDAEGTIVAGRLILDWLERAERSVTTTRDAALAAAEHAQTAQAKVDDAGRGRFQVFRGKRATLELARSELEASLQLSNRVIAGLRSLETDLTSLRSHLEMIVPSETDTQGADARG